MWRSRQYQIRRRMGPKAVHASNSSRISVMGVLKRFIAGRRAHVGPSVCGGAWKLQGSACPGRQGRSAAQAVPGKACGWGVAGRSEPRGQGAGGARRRAGGTSIRREGLSTGCGVARPPSPSVASLVPGASRRNSRCVWLVTRRPVRRLRLLRRRCSAAWARRRTRRPRQRQRCRKRPTGRRARSDRRAVKH